MEQSINLLFLPVIYYICENKKRNMKKLLSILMLLTLITACKKDDSEDTPEDQPVNVTYSFDDVSALDAWTITTPNNAVATIDAADKVAGTGSLKVFNGCCVINLKNGIQLKANTDYGLTVNGKRTPWGANDTVCPYQHPIGLYILQGDNELYGTPIGNSPDWKNESFYFNSKEGTEPVTIRIMFNSKVCWVDELKFEEI